MKKPLTALLIGAGNRGVTYGGFALEYPEELNFIAVAEPLERRRTHFAHEHNITSNSMFASWKEILNRPKFADIAIICTQDQMHTEPSLLALERGYDVLLEKPMAHTLEECIKIVKKAEETGRALGICHVLRYTDFFQTIYKTIERGRLGKLINITQRENIGYYHFAHSYVRGKWANRDQSSPMILAKCCHDLDLLYWFMGSLPTQISSTGDLIYFTKENAPQNAPQYCVEGCPISEECLYYAPRIYIEIEPIIQIVNKSNKTFYKFIVNLRKNHKKLLTILSKLIPLLKRLRYWRDWPVTHLYENESEDYSDEAKINLLKTSPYGRCVYHSKNDVLDHQLVSIKFENGCTANLCVHGFAPYEGRTIRIDGQKGTLIGEFMAYGEKITFIDPFSGKEDIIYKKELDVSGAQHGGGDYQLLKAFIQDISTKSKSPLTNAREILESHIMAFAADKAREDTSVINMERFRSQYL